MNALPQMDRRWHGKFLPENRPEVRSQMYSWLMFIATGIGPFSGQAVHFRHFAPEPKDYALNRYTFEARRHWQIIDDHLATRSFMVNEEYTIVDMALWGWARMATFVMGEENAVKYPNVKRLADEISARPAAAKAIALKDIKSEHVVVFLDLNLKAYVSKEAVLAPNVQELVNPFLGIKESVRLGKIDEEYLDVASGL